MPLLASNYDGFLETLVLWALAYAALSAAPFVLYYLALSWQARGLRPTTLGVLAASFGFVVYTSLAMFVGPFIISEDSVFSGAINVLCCGFFPSIFLGVALLADTKHLWAALAPIVGLALACISALTFTQTDFGRLTLIAPITVWHLTVLAALIVYARPAWKLQAIRPGVCPSCGYSTQGLAEGCPCPECGTLHPHKVA